VCEWEIACELQRRGRAAVYNSLLEICARTRDMVRGEEVVGRMARAGVLPDEDTAEARPPAAARRRARLAGGSCMRAPLMCALQPLLGPLTDQ